MELNSSDGPSIVTDIRQPNPEHIKVLILGSGPAGLSAAIYAARANLNPVVLSGDLLGGQVSLTYTVENYPGFPDGVGGMQLVDLFQKQAERFGARIEFDTASAVNLTSRPFHITTTNGKYYLADTLIIASGASANQLGIPGECKYTGRGVSYCATCDGWFFKDKDVIVVGGGDSALEESIFLARYSRTITIVHRRDKLRGGILLQERAYQNPKIKFYWNTVITEILGGGVVEKVRLRNIETGEESEQPIQGVFIFTGHSPNTTIFKDLLAMDERGYLIVDPFMQTSTPGVFAAGESADPHFRQVITSSGMGAAAAISAQRFLDKLEETTA